MEAKTIAVDRQQVIHPGRTVKPRGSVIPTHAEKVAINTILDVGLPYIFPFLMFFLRRSPAVRWLRTGNLRKPARVAIVNFQKYCVSVITLKN